MKKTFITYPSSSSKLRNRQIRNNNSILESLSFWENGSNITNTQKATFYFSREQLTDMYNDAFQPNLPPPPSNPKKLKKKNLTNYLKSKYFTFQEKEFMKKEII